MFAYFLLGECSVFIIGISLLRVPADNAFNYKNCLLSYVYQSPQPYEFARFQWRLNKVKGVFVNRQTAQGTGLLDTALTL